MNLNKTEIKDVFVEYLWLEVIERTYLNFLWFYKLRQHHPEKKYVLMTYFESAEQTECINLAMSHL